MELDQGESEGGEVVKKPRPRKIAVLRARAVDLVDA